MSSKTSQLQPRALTVRQFSETYGVSRATTYKMISDGEIEARKAGGRTLIPVDAAEAWFKALPGIYDMEAR